MHKISVRHATSEPMQLQPRWTALGLNNTTLYFGASCAKNTSRPATRWDCSQSKMAKTTRMFSIAKLKLERERERPRWNGYRMTESKMVRLGLRCVWGYPPSLVRPAYPCGLPTRHYLDAYPNCSVPKKPTTSKKSILALIVINKVRHFSTFLISSRVPPMLVRFFRWFTRYSLFPKIYVLMLPNAIKFWNCYRSQK